MVRARPAVIVVPGMIVVPGVIVTPRMIVVPGMSIVPRAVRGGGAMVAPAMTRMNRPPDPALVELDAGIADRARAGRIGILVAVRAAAAFVGRARADQGQAGNGSKQEEPLHHPSSFIRA